MKSEKPNNEAIRSETRARYSTLASESSGKCCQSGEKESLSIKIGYTQEEIDAVPDGADMGLGCGNPSAIAELKEGETVVDLGSGGGFDIFLAARQVGPTGKAIGVDMTPDMVQKARQNLLKTDFKNVEFRLGAIEDLPIDDSSVDALISNCVINLSPEKEKVFAEAARALKPGGRLAISDVVAVKELPDRLRGDLRALSCCVGGAESVDQIERMLDEAGFEEISIDVDPTSVEFIKDWAPGPEAREYIRSAKIRARRK